ncbi:MAG: protease complex subunit PrcB family protein [Chloroflexi bacterium]|nr:protease complex subunit PrcB family protein [Chloroflexota bacterium]
MKIPTTFAAVALLLTVFSAACGDDEQEVLTPTLSPTETPPASAQIDFDTFLVGGNSGVMIEEPSIFKIETQEAWAELWSTHVSVVVPTPTSPDVAFDDKMLIAVFDREQSTGGFAIQVQSIVVDESGIVVEVLRTVPGRGCAVTQALTQPFHMVLADAADGDVQLALTDQALDC